MQINLPWFSIQIHAKINLISRSALRAKASAEQERREAFESAWTETLLAWDVAPELIAKQDDLRPCLRLVLKGAAEAIAKDQVNPLSAWTKSSTLSGWAWLAKAVSSPAAMEPEHPFHQARQVLTKNLGTFDSCIGSDGGFRLGSSLLLRNLDPQVLSAVSQRLGVRLHELDIASVAKAAPASGRAARL